MQKYIAANSSLPTGSDALLQTAEKKIKKVLYPVRNEK